MNIAYFTSAFPPQGFGVGHYVGEMSRALREAGCGVTIITARVAGCPDVADTEHGRVLRLYDYPAGLTPALYRQVVDCARQAQADVIEGTDYLGECAGLLSIKARPPLLIKMHSSDALRVLRESQIQFAWQRPLLWLALLRKWRRLVGEYRVLQRADLLLATSQRGLRELEQQFSRLPSLRCAIPNPILPPSGWRNQERDAPTILLAGRLDMGKGLAYLPEIMRAVVRQCPNVVLEIAGADSYARGLGSLKSWLEKQLGPLQAQVRFLGALDRSGMEEAFRRAWVVMVPSRWDNFPSVVLEAMVREKAIVASPHGGMPEMLAGTDCAIAAPHSPEFAGRIVRYLQDPVLRHQAGVSACKKAVTEYAPAHIAQKYLEWLSINLPKVSV